MKTLCTRLAGADLATTDLGFYNHFVNSLPADYDVVIAVCDPSPLYSVDTLCERFRAIELRRKELRTSKLVLLVKRGESKSVKTPNAGQGGEKSNQRVGSPWKQKGTCWGCGKAWFRGHDCPSRRAGKGPGSSD